MSDLFSSDPAPTPGILVPKSLDGHAPSLADQASEALATLRLIKWLLLVAIVVEPIAFVYWFTDFGRQAAAWAEIVGWP